MDTATVERKASQLELARLKNASEEYKVHKSNYKDPITDEELPGFQTWPVFRDEFLADWKSNRRVVTEKEADVIFDQIADESLTELETIGVTLDVNTVVDEAEKAEQEDATVPLVDAPTAADFDNSPVLSRVITVMVPKRRGRPPGKKVATAKVVRKVVSKKAKSASKSKKVAAKKKSGSTAEKAQAIVERYVERGWQRKDVIEKLVSSIDGLGTAYAASLYQKYS